MVAARYWRAVGMASRGGGDVEVSALHLYQAPVADAHYESVALLLHCEGDNGSTVFVDSSPRPKTVTARSGAQLSTAEASAGASALYFDSSASHARVAPHADFGFGTGDFTLECWVKYSSYAGARPLTLFNGLTGVVQLYISGGGALVVETGDTAGGGGGTVPLNTWVHLAVTREGGVVRSFVGGLKVYEYTDARALATPANININQYGNASGYGGVGYVDEVRITKGVARYTEGFVPSRAAFPDSAYSGGLVRVDGGATLSSTIPLVSGNVAHLQDSNILTTARFNPRPGGAALVWDFGSGGDVTVTDARIGSAALLDRFMSHFDLQYSANGVHWTQASRLGRFTWPGPNAAPDLEVGYEALSADATLTRAHTAASAPVPAHATPGALCVATVRDTEFGGRGRVRGTVKEKGSPDMPASRRVRLVRERDGLLVREQWSDPVTGVYDFPYMDELQTYTVQSYDHTRNYRAVIADGLTLANGTVELMP